MGSTLKIGGKTIGVGQFAWPFVAGPISPAVEIQLDEVDAVEIDQLKNPVDVEITQTTDYGSTGGTIEKLYLGSTRNEDPWRRLYTLRDSRWPFEQLRVSAQFNVVRVSEARKAVDRINNAGFPDFRTTAKYRYLPATLRAPGGVSRFYRGGSDSNSVNRVLGVPWTALEAVKWLLSPRSLGSIGARTGETIPSISVQIDARDNGYQLQDQVFAEERFPVVLATLLQLARVQMTVMPDGTWRLYDVDSTDVPASLGGYDGAGFVGLHRLKRERPRKVVVRFPRWHEIQLTYGETAPRLETQYLTPINVVRLPENLVVDGVQRFAGEFVDLQDAIEAWNAIGWARGAAMTIRELDKYVDNPQGLILWAFDGNTGSQINEAQGRRLMALAQSYLRVWQIPRPMMDLIADWAPVRVGLVDPITGYQQPSPIWQDYAVIPSGQISLRGAKPTKFFSRNYYYPTGRLTTANAAPADLQIVDKARGIFALAWRNDLSTAIGEYSRNAFANEINASMRKVFRGDALREHAALQSSFKFTTIISARLLTPNHTRAQYGVELTATGAGLEAEGPPYEIFYADEPARIAWIDGFSGIRDTDDGIEITGGEIVNATALDALANGEAARVFYSFTDRPAGRYRRWGFDPSVDKQNGAIQTMQVLVDGESGAIETEYVIPAKTPAPSLWELTPPAVRKLRYKRIEG